MGKQCLIISLALNGYQLTYHQHLKTHQRYANRIGAEHLLVTKPFISKLGVECCWLKLYLTVEAMQQGYQHILILDADAWVKSTAPDIRNEIVENKYIYMAKGYSERFNSGVMLVVNNKKSYEFLTNVINNRLMNIPSEDSVGWGENGHIIHFAKRTNIVHELPIEWNNTVSTNIKDYICHQNHGPLRRSLTKRILHKYLAKISRFMTRLMVYSQSQTAPHLPTLLFLNELKTIVKAYPLLSQHD